MTAKYAAVETHPRQTTQSRSALDPKDRDKDAVPPEPPRRATGYVPPQPAQLESPRTAPQTPTATPVSGPAVGATSANQPRPDTASQTRLLPAKG